MDKEQLLRDACENGRLDEAKPLVDEGVDVDSKYVDENGYTPLIIAVVYVHVDIVRFLLDRGADIDAKSNGSATALHYAAWNGNDAAARLLIERGADLHMKTNSGLTPLDVAKQHNQSSTAAIIEAAMQSIKVIYSSSEELRENMVTFEDFSNHIIIVADNDIPNGFKFGGHPVITLRHVQQYIDQLLPTADNEDNIPPNNIHDILAPRYPILTARLQHWGMNALHLIAYLPQVLSNDMYEVISSIVMKCPQAATMAVDIDGMTPLHHAAINLSKKKTSQECYDLLLARSPPIVVHRAIKAGMGWGYLHPIVMAKPNALTVEDKESGLVPFMLSAEKCSNEDDDDMLSSLSMAYELLCLGPDVIMEYDKSIMTKRSLDGNVDSSDQDTKRARG